MPTKLSISVARNVVIWTNTLTLITGIILFAIGLYDLLSPKNHLYSNVLPITTLIVGLLVFLVSIIGCCGAMWQHRPILLVYFVFFATLVVIQVIVVILAFVNSHNVDSVLDKAWQAAYDKNPKIIRDIEEEYMCCGFKNVKDRAFPKTNPDACVTSPWFGYNTPCYNSIYNSYRRHQTSLATWGIILASIQLLALGFSILLIYKIPDDQERERECRVEYQRLVEEGQEGPRNNQPKQHDTRDSDNRGPNTTYGSVQK